MKQFNLEEYLRLKEETGKEPKLVTDLGDDARVICTDADNEFYPVIVLAGFGAESPFSVTKDGRKFPGDFAFLFFADLDEEPTYRPYKNAEECFKDVVKHGGWYRDQHGAYCHICKVADYGFSGLSFSAIAQYYTWADDGSPCGVKEGEA